MNLYQVARDGKTLGEFEESQILEGLQTGYFQSPDWCWREGMSEWQSLEAKFQRAKPQPMTPSLMPPPVNPYAAPQAFVRASLVSSRAYAEKASAGSRLGAYILDLVSMFACFLPSVLMDGSVSKGNDLPLYASLGFLGILWITNLILIATDGQTVGKRLMGIRIAQIEDSTKAGFIQIVFLRTLLGKGALGLVPLYSLVDVLFVFSEDGRCLHDKIGGTHVVKVPVG